MQIFRRLLRTHKLRVARAASLIFITSAVVCFCSVYMNRLSGSLGQAAIDRDTRLLYRILLLMTAVFIVTALFEIISTLTVKRFSARTEYSFRETFARRIVSVSFRTLSARSGGDLMSVYSNDLSQAVEMFASDIPRIITEFLTLLISAVFMAFIQPWLTLIFFLLFPPLTLLQIKISAPIQVYAAEASEKRGIYNATVNDSLQNTAVVVAYSLQNILERRYQGQYAEYFKAQLRRIKVFVRLVIAGIIASMTPTFFIFVASALFVASGKMEPGSFITLTTMALSANSFLSMLSQRLSSIQTELAAAGRLTDALPDVSENTMKDDAAFRSSAPVYEFRDVSFSYGANTEHKILDHISFAIENHSSVAIVGTSGCGKSTLMKLMLSLLSPDEGSMMVFGADTKNVSPHRLRSMISYVPQDCYLFPGTIRENLALAREKGDQDDAAMQAACRDAGILPFIEAQPNGFDTILTESADNISGGQRQRLAIARALYRNAPILLLDEATSGLDPATEQALLDSLSASASAKTMIVIAHRLAAVTSCDRIMVMDHGHIAEDGSYEELMASNSLFAALYREQIAEAQNQMENSEVRI